MIKITEIKITKLDKKAMFCQICCTETIHKILEFPIDNDFKCELFCELFDYVQQKSLKNFKKELIKYLNKNGIFSIERNHHTENYKAIFIDDLKKELNKIIIKIKT